jgi:uncharacterized membrane protein (UPF0182 family)
LARSIRSPLARLRSLRGGRLALAIGIALGVLLVALKLAAKVHVNVLWFRSVGYEDVLWRRLTWSWGVRGAVGVVVAAFLFANPAEAQST